MKTRYLTKSPSQTKKLGEALAGKILSMETKAAFTIGLEGELGGGKTTFLQGFARGLGIREKILSPTFTIMRKFEIRTSKFEINSKTELPGTEAKGEKRTKSSSPSQSPKFRTFYHIDCYRIEEPKELLDIGFKDIASNPKSIVAVEWADKIKNLMPKNADWIQFKLVSPVRNKSLKGGRRHVLKVGRISNDADKNKREIVVTSVRSPGQRIYF